MSKAYSGLEGVVTSNGTDMDVKDSSFDVETGDIDTTTTGDDGWEDSIDGPRKVSGSFDFFYNKLKSPFGAVAKLMPGAAAVDGVYPSLSFNTGGGDLITGKARITKLSKKGAVKDGIMYTASFTSKGKWTFPS